MSYPISHGSDGRSLVPESSPGLRTLVVPRMAARGIALPEIASITHVPLALVELIAGERSGKPQTHEVLRARPGPAAGPVHRRRRVPQRKHLIWLATFIFLATALLASVLLHAPILPLAVMLAGGWLGRFHDPTG